MINLKSYINKPYKEIAKKIYDETDYYPGIMFVDGEKKNIITDKRTNRIILEIKDDLVIKAYFG